MTFDRTTMSPAEPSAADAVTRLSLTPAGLRPGRLDGDWWPGPYDLLLELPALAAVLNARWGRVTRVTLNPTHWPVIPSRIPVARHVVHGGWFGVEQDPNEIVVRSFRAGRLDLLVVPPGTTPGRPG
ncbi:DUF5994 family protein [Kitasatospora sp. NPDC085895]|uniref:DUF5994 family protein n=1 Tax=Kitasatospora sp. NPDC085895 TaxID=3155057 RepID=UPI00344BDE8C